MTEDGNRTVSDEAWALFWAALIVVVWAAVTFLGWFIIWGPA